LTSRIVKNNVKLARIFSKVGSFFISKFKSQTFA